MRRVVITGVGAISPCGSNAQETWEAVYQAQSGIRKISHFDAHDWPVQIAAEVKDFQPDAYISGKLMRRMDRFAQFAWVAAEEALQDAGLDEPLGERAGVYIGSGIGGVAEISEGALRHAERGVRGLGAFFITRSLPNLAGGLIAQRFGITGPSLCVSTACAAGNHSIGEAYRAILFGDADVVVAGGTEAPIVPTGVGGFMVMKALSRRNDEPQKASRPFDVERDGFVIGEGAGVLVLEELSHAQQRNAKIYAELIGYAQTNDAYHISAPPPRHAGAARCMSRAIDSANIKPTDVNYINAHGTSTMQNDLNECLAIQDVFGDWSKCLQVSSTKGCTGHLLGAAGGVESVLVALALHKQQIPPTANLEHPEPQSQLDLVPKSGRSADFRIAMSNSFGFGGVNATLLFQRWEYE